MSYSLIHRAFERQCLRAHNRYRALHGCPPLILNQRLIDGANEWAEELSEYDTPWHTTNPCLGENIYVTRAICFNGDVPVNVWYDEVCNYDFETTRGFLKAGHFTQIVWKCTKRMGVGFARSGRTTIVVARYHPPGNVLGEYRLNIPPELIFFESDYTEDDLTSTDYSISKISRSSRTSKTSGNKSVDNKKSRESKEREKTKSSGKTRRSTASIKSGDSQKTIESEKSGKSGKSGKADKSGKEGESSKTGKAGESEKTADSEKAGSSKEAAKTKEAGKEKTVETKEPDDKTKKAEKPKDGGTQKTDKSK